MKTDHIIEGLRSEIDSLPRNKIGHHGKIPEDIARKALDAYRHSDLNASKFCALIGISQPTLKVWSEKDKDARKPKFHELPVVEPAEPKKPRVYRLATTSGITVELDDLGSVAKLLKIIAAE
jgi:hypothetical protein